MDMMITQRERVKAAKKLMSKPETKFLQEDLSNRAHPDWMTRCFTNNRYVVMIMDDAPTTKGNAIRVMIQRHDNIPIPRHWLEMQRIKNEIFGKQTTGIEYFPTTNALVDVANIYWMWIFPDGVLPIPLIP